MKFKTWMVGAFLALAIGPIGAVADELTEVSIALSSGSMPSGAALMASELGLFEKHGLKATIVPMESASVATMAMLSGSTTFSSGGVSDVILAASKGQDMIAVESQYRGFAGMVLLSSQVAKARGFDPQVAPEARFRALDGMSVASPSATSTFTFALKAWAEATGVKLDFVYMSSNAMGAALAAGAVDAIITSAPFYVEPVLNGTASLWLNGAKGDIPAQYLPVHASVLQTSSAYAKANPAVIDKMRAVSKDFAAISAENPELIKTAMMASFPVSEEAVAFILAHESFGNKGQPLSVADMGKEIDFLTAAGVALPETLDLPAMVWRGE